NTFSNYREEEVVDGKGNVRLVRVGLPVQSLAERVRQITGGWPRRVGPALFAEDPGPRPLWLERHTQLFAWVSRHLPGGDSNGLVWGDADDMVSEGCFHAYLGQTAESFEAVE